MKKWGPLLVAVVSLALSAGCGGSAGNDQVRGDSVVTSNSSGKQCAAGYVTAKLPWGTKCLVHGERCKSGKSKAYKRYGFTCTSQRRLD
jgi:hypothetical protein